MKSRVELNFHIDERGWINGSIYINVTPKVNNDRGKLVVELGNFKNELGKGKLGKVLVYLGELMSFSILFASLYYTICIRRKPHSACI